MTRNEYMAALSYELSGLPQAEIARILEYYDEHFLEALEEGKTEEQICSELESPATVAARVRAELAFVRAEQRPGASTLNTVLLVIIGVFALPIGIPLAFALVMVLFAMAAVLVSLVAAAFVVVICFGIVGITCLVMGIYSLFTGFGLIGAALLGAAFLLIGLGILGIIGSVYMFRGVIRLIVRIFRKIYISIDSMVNKKKSANLKT